MSDPLAFILEQAEQRGFHRGLQSATAIQLGETGYGSGQHAVIVITAKSRRELSRKVNACKWRKYGDNPGQAFMGDCVLLRALRNDYGTWEGICISSTHWDI